MCFHFPRSRNSLPDPEEVTMSIDRTELADALAEATGWSVTTDPHRGLWEGKGVRRRDCGTGPPLCRYAHSTGSSRHGRGISGRAKCVCGVTYRLE